jgi:hypothetical protein
MTPFQRHEATERTQARFEAAFHTAFLAALAALAWWLS